MTALEAVIDQCLRALHGHSFAQVRRQAFRAGPVPALVIVEFERFTPVKEGRRDLRLLVGGPESRHDGEGLSSVVADFVMSQQNPTRDDMYDLRSPAEQVRFVEDFDERFVPVVADSVDPEKLSKAISQGSAIPFGANKDDRLATATPLLELSEAYGLESAKAAAIRILMEARAFASTRSQIEEVEDFAEAWSLDL